MNKKTVVTSKNKTSESEKNKLLAEINEITLNEDLSSIRTINKINDLKSKMAELSKETSIVVNKKASQASLKNGEYYQTMSATYIDDNGEISEVYRINDEIVTKEAYDEWSYDYFNGTRLNLQKQEEEKLRKDIINLEEQLNTKRELFLKKTNSGNAKYFDIRNSWNSKKIAIFLKKVFYLKKYKIIFKRKNKE